MLTPNVTESQSRTNLITIVHTITHILSYRFTFLTHCTCARKPTSVPSRQFYCLFTVFVFVYVYIFFHFSWHARVRALAPDPRARVRMFFCTAVDRLPVLFRKRLCYSFARCYWSRPLAQSCNIFLSFIYLFFIVCQDESHEWNYSTHIM